MVFKYHPSKYTKNYGKIFIRSVAPADCWLDQAL